MLITDFVHIFSDAIQTHEGYLTTGGASWPNLNPGNLHFEEQLGASGTIGSEAKFGNFFDGKQALNNDIAAKLAKFNTIQEIIQAYAPPSQNNTPAYIVAVVAFFNSRNIPITATMAIDSFVALFGKPVVLVAINQIYAPGNWAAVQAIVTQCAAYMPNYVFSCRYSNVNLSGTIQTIENSTPPGGQYSGPSGDAIKGVLVPYNQGQILNLVIYDGSIMQGHPEPFGGCEYQGETIDPVSGVASVMYQGAAFIDSNARAMWHELIHELFKITQQTDTLHEYLVAHGGYQADLAIDLGAVFTGNQLNTLAAVANLEKEKNNL